ncbi:MAG: outer membrane protein assembly factor BamB [Pseudomonadota bacterium]
MRVVTIILISLFLFGCTTLSETLVGLTDSLLGGTDNQEPPVALMPLEAEIGIRKVWRENVGVGYDDQFVKLVPAVSDGKVIAADREGLVRAYDIRDGDELWETETEKAVSSGPGIGYRTVLLGTSNAQVIALNSDDGAVLWTADVSSEILSIPRAEKGVVVVRSIDGKVIALSEDRGTELWSFERTEPALSLRGTGSPVIIGDVIIDGYDSGKLIALQLNDGKQLWETSIAIPRGRSELERLVDLDADPVVVDNVAYVAGFQSGVSAVSLGDGDVLWRREELSSSAGMSADWRYLYLTDDESHVWQLDQRNGAALWKQRDLHRRKLTAPVAYDRFIVVGDYEGYLHWLSQDDGHQMGRVRVTDEPIMAAPVVMDDVVYVYASDGTLAAYAVE